MYFEVEASRSRGRQMVVTFLVVPSFRESATYLCRTHLGKQRTEAMQIHNALLDLDYLSWYFEVEPPSRGCDQSTLYAWIDEVMTLYKQLPYRFVCPKQTPSGPITDIVPVQIGFKFVRAKDADVVSIDGDMVHLATKTGLHPRDIPLNQFLPSDRRVIGDGLRKHPVMVLWYTYTQALGEYINAHIEEWVNRGYVNNMATYTPSGDVEYPDWVSNPEFHRRMRARMREKEIAWHQEYQEGSRKQKPEIWYTIRPMFVDAGPDDGYLW